MRNKHEDLGFKPGDIISGRIKSEVLAASIRNTRQFRECALVGAHIATVPFSVIQQLLGHKLTREGMAGFTKDIVPEYANLGK